MVDARSLVSAGFTTVFLSGMAALVVTTTPLIDGWKLGIICYVLLPVSVLGAAALICGKAQGG